MNLRSALCVAVVVLCCSVRAAPVAPINGHALAPIPPAPDRAKAEKSVREIFRTDFLRQGAESRKALAAKLLTEGMQGENLATRYVLLQDSSDLAAAAGDVKSAFRALDTMAAMFAVDGFELKNSALNTAGRSARTPADAADLAGASLSLSDEAVAAGRFDLAAKLAVQAETQAKTSRDVALYNDAHAKADEAQAALREAQKVKIAQEKLKQHPDDPGANLVVGKFLCFVKGDWEGGLHSLSHGSDRTLAAVAALDVANPSDPKAQLAVGDAWSALSQNPKVGVKIGAARRAAYWYRKAVPGLSGLEKIGAQKRLWATARAASGAHVTAFKFATDGEPLLLPLNDPSPDVLTLTQQTMVFHISGTKTFDVAQVAGRNRGHLGKAVLLSGTEAGGSMHVEVAALNDHTHYDLLLMDKRDVIHLQALPLEPNVNYSWQLLERDGSVLVEVTRDEKIVGSISLPFQDYKNFGFGVTVRWPGNKADITISLD
ncbi:MAG TPA: hypothetical protein VFC46_08755 [Humisphaera sp.]|nr:hypothetical protein [Humisphaera sp.]